MNVLSAHPDDNDLQKLLIMMLQIAAPHHHEELEDAGVQDTRPGCDEITHCKVQTRMALLRWNHREQMVYLSATA